MAAVQCGPQGGGGERAGSQRGGNPVPPPGALVPSESTPLCRKCSKELGKSGSSDVTVRCSRLSAYHKCGFFGSKLCKNRAGILQKAGLGTPLSPKDGKPWRWGQRRPRAGPCSHSGMAVSPVASGTGVLMARCHPGCPARSGTGEEDTIIQIRVSSHSPGKTNHGGRRRSHTHTMQED